MKRADRMDSAIERLLIALPAFGAAEQRICLHLRPEYSPARQLSQNLSVAGPTAGSYHPSP
jgi:hypothetical protein